MFSVSSNSASVSPGKPTMKSPEIAISGRAARTRSMIAQIAAGAVAAVHRLEDAVAARLHRQMEEGHQLLDLGMGADQALGHVVGVAGRVADPLEAGQRGRARGSGRRGPAPSSRRPGIHVLAEQGDFARAARRPAPGLVEDRRPRPGDFGAARIGHDAIGAEFVAAFLDGEEGARPPARGGRGARRTWTKPACRCRGPRGPPPPRATRPGRR